MKRLGVEDIAISEIDVQDRLRSIDPSWVEALAAMIGETGLQQPIQVLINPKAIGRYRLIAGAHRLEAVRSRGETAIQATVFKGSLDEARLQEIDENVMRRELSALDRAGSLAERKALYERLHPETKHGAQGGRGGQQNVNGMLPFTKATAEKLGFSVRTIERAVALWTNLDAEARQMLALHPAADNMAGLRKLAALDSAKQITAARHLLDGSAQSIAEATALADPTVKSERPSDDNTACKLIDAWSRSSRRGRLQFMRNLVAKSIIAGFDEGKIR